MERLRRLLAIRHCYKRVFASEDGKAVLGDLIRKHILTDPIADDAEATLVNVGMQRATVHILKNVYGSDEDLRAAIEKEISQVKHTPIEQ